jgi:hypothetical protein
LVLKTSISKPFSFSDVGGRLPTYIITPIKVKWV